MQLWARIYIGDHSIGEDGRIYERPEVVKEVEISIPPDPEDWEGLTERQRRLAMEGRLAEMGDALLDVLTDAMELLLQEYWLKKKAGIKQTFH